MKYARLMIEFGTSCPASELHAHIQPPSAQHTCIQAIEVFGEEAAGFINLIP